MGLSHLVLILSFLSSMAYAETEREKIFSLMGNLPKVTTAKIRRGPTEIQIDLTHPSAKSQIQDYDVIVLGEGVYSTLGDFTAKYVRVRGLGPRKTFITSNIKDFSPILVNSTEFWDLSIANAQFKISDVNGLWAVNVEFAGAVYVKAASLEKSPAFAIRSVFSDLTHSDLPAEEKNLYSHFLTKQGENYLMPLPGDDKELREKRSVANLLAYEDRFDRTKDIILKNRIGHKGLFARGLNYLYQKKEVPTPKYNHAKFNQLAKNARSTKARGHYYVSMLYWAEADRLSGHTRFDEVLKEITPLNQSLGQECGCTVEGQGLVTSVNSQIEKNLYAKIPITGLAGNCKIQTFHVIIPEGGKKADLISAARLQAQSNQAIAYQAREDKFQKTIMASSSEEEFLVGAAAPVSPSVYTAVADVEMAGFKQSYTSDVVVSNDNGGNTINKNIVDPIAKIFKEKFASTIKAARAKVASADLVAKLDGFITQLLYGDDPARQLAYEELHEQQFGRKVSAPGAMSSVFAY